MEPEREPGETSLWSAARQSAKSTASQAGAAVRDVRQAVAKVSPTSYRAGAQPPAANEPELIAALSRRMCSAASGTPRRGRAFYPLCVQSTMMKRRMTI